jgi:predicted transcriptional regulator
VKKAMGIIYQIKEYLEIHTDGLTITELSKKLNIERANVNTTVNREVKKNGLIEYAGFKRSGSKVYRLRQRDKSETKTEVSENCSELLQKNLDSNVFLMEFFQENKAKLQAKAFDKQEKFKEVIDVMDETEKALGDDNE